MVERVGFEPTYAEAGRFTVFAMLSTGVYGNLKIPI